MRPARRPPRGQAEERPLATGSAGIRLLEDARDHARYSSPDTPGCVVKQAEMPPEFTACPAVVTHAGLLHLAARAFLVFTCSSHTSDVIAARPLLDRDRAELARRRDRVNAARPGHQPPPIEPLKVGTAARQLIERARARTARHTSE